MVYKNGIKEWATTFCVSGFVYGVWIGLFYRDVTMGIIAGLLFAILFTLFLVIFSNHIEKKANNIRNEISNSRKIVCEGPANHKKGANAIGGWMFLTEETIEFYPHKVNIGGSTTTILINNIASIQTKFNQLKIDTKTGEAYTFVVNKANLWQQSIVEKL